MSNNNQELIERNKELYCRLKEQSIYSLRTYGREIGVLHPTLKKKDELIVNILKI